MSFRNHGSVLGFLLVGVLAGCAPAAKPRGQLMIAVATDMSIPKNMDQVVVEVLDEQGNKQTFDYPVKPTDLGKPMPGTLAIVPPNAGGQTVRVRLIAELDMSPAPPTVRVVREAVVKVPTDRTALLPMPLHWLCDGHYKENDDGTYQSDCADDTQTCVAGQCVDAVIATETLKDYEPQLVFGGGDDQGNGGHCIDIPTCFGASAAAVPDGDCTLPLADSVDMSSFNVALELAAGSDGECTMAAVSRCFLPLDSDPVEGWWIDGGRVHLPPAACDVIAHGKALGVATTGMCPTKDPSVPICGRWTNVSTSSLSPGGSSTGDIMSGHDGGGVSSNGPDASTRTGADGSAPTTFGCVSNDQCGGGACINAECAPPCKSDTVCGSGTVCVRVSGVGGCAHVPCGNCLASTGCSAPEGLCRNTCKTADECWGDQSCASGGLCTGGGGAPSTDAGVDGAGGASASSGGGPSGGGGAPDAGTPSASQNYRLSGSVSRGPGVMFTEQGQLFNSASVPIDGVQLPCAFALYSVPNGGTALWTETQSIKPAKGAFSATLGSVDPIGTDVLATSPLFLGITIGPDAEMTPRQQVVGPP
jgi:hypothetical protein